MNVALLFYNIIYIMKAGVIFFSYPVNVLKMLKSCPGRFSLDSALAQSHQCRSDSYIPQVEACYLHRNRAAIMTNADVLYNLVSCFMMIKNGGI